MNYKNLGIIALVLVIALAVVPLCHRRSSDGGDRLEIDLKVKEYAARAPASRSASARAAWTSNGERHAVEGSDGYAS